MKTNEQLMAELGVVEQAQTIARSRALELALTLAESIHAAPDASTIDEAKLRSLEVAQRTVIALDGPVQELARLANSALTREIHQGNVHRGSTLDKYNQNGQVIERQGVAVEPSSVTTKRLEARG